MAEKDERLLKEEKDSTSGLGTLVGLSAAAALPFLRPFRNAAKIKRAFETITRSNAQRTTASESLVPLLPKPGITAFKAKVPTKVKYKKQQAQVPAIRNNVTPLINDREDFMKAQNMLSMNDRSPQSLFGSSLYDQIKMFPKDKAPADDWIRYFNQKKNVKYQDGRSASIDAEELFDTNIASLDKSGALKGGVLKTAKDMNMEVDKNTLLAQVRSNPFNRLELRRYVSPTGVDESIEGMVGEAEKIKRVLGTKYLDETGEPITKNLINTIDETLGDMRAMRFDLGQSGIDNINLSAKNLRQALKKSLDQISDPQDRQMINQAIRNVNGLAEEGVMKINAVPRTPRHATSSEYGTYRLEGEQSPGEFVWHFAKDKAPKGPNRHMDRYHWDDARQPVVHTMYGTRYTPQGQKVISLNEVQADIQQAVFDDVTKGLVRVNDEGREAASRMLLQGMTEPRETITKIMKKGLYATEDEKYQLRRAFDQLKAGRKSLAGSAGIPKDQLADYLPFFNNKNYADLAVKTAIKEGGQDGAQWVGVIPVNAINRGNGAIKGNQQFYGYASGKGFQQKGEAVIPELMRKLAKQYKTEAKTIQVSLSDPKKPYKVVKFHEVRRYDGPKDAAGPSVETYKQPYHSNAFKTKQEALDAGFTESKIKYYPEGDPNLYMNMFALRLSPDMIQKPMKLYKKEGGLIESVFRPL